MPYGFAYNKTLRSRASTTSSKIIFLTEKKLPGDIDNISRPIFFKLKRVIFDEVMDARPL